MANQLKAAANKASIPQLKDLTSYVRNLAKEPPKIDLSKVQPYIETKLTVSWAGFSVFDRTD